ncbi:MAG TPA: type II toxin-antitoxin system HicA family toxin [Anaerolineae bacterium]
MKVRDIIKRLEQDGWYLISIEGSHRQYKRRNTQTQRGGFLS